MEENRFLDHYLGDHYAGGGGGLALARRIAGQNKDNDYGAEMKRIANEIEEDRETLGAVMDQFGVGRPKVRTIAARSGELLGRLKPNGTLISYSPLSRVIELEGMIMGVTGKLELWRSLLAIEATDARLDRTVLEGLERRAEDQRARLERLHDRAAREALAAGAAAPDG
jgi:hypothetical protein